MLSFCLFIYLYIFFVLYCYMHLLGVVTPMISANKPYHHHIYIYIYIYIYIDNIYIYIIYNCKCINNIVYATISL